MRVVIAHALGLLTGTLLPAKVVGTAARAQFHGRASKDGHHLLG
jgi:hypothetical protein